jgi:putative endonuclease
LVWYQEFLEPNQAISFEKKIKKWSRAKKEAIINGEWDLLPILA